MTSSEIRFSRTGSLLDFAMAATPAGVGEYGRSEGVLSHPSRGSPATAHHPDRRDHRSPVQALVERRTSFSPDDRESGGSRRVRRSAGFPPRTTAIPPRS